MKFFSLAPDGSRRSRELTGGGSRLKHIASVAEQQSLTRAPIVIGVQRKHPMAAINSVADLAIEGEVAVVTINSPPVNALSQAVRDGLKRGRRGGRGERRGQGDRHHLRRADLHRRRRHCGIRQAARPRPTFPKC